MKKICFLFCCLLITLCGCKNNQITYEYKPIVTMEFESFGEIKIELYPNIAPNTVANFVNLIEDGFYDGNNIHRVYKNFVIQGGDPKGNGTGGPGYSIKGEFSANGFDNNLTHERGVISMARRSENNNSAGSQFFIVLDDSAKSSLDGLYAGFGKVIEGMDIIDKMVEEAKYKSGSKDILEENYIIKKVTVDTFGETYKVKKVS